MRQPVTGRYALRGPNRVGFQVGAYNPGHTLYIDPVLNYSSYLGGSGADDGQALAVDTAGNAYLTGSATVADFPGSSSLITVPGGLEVFVSKLDSTGTAVVYTTYLGGSADDEGRALTVDVSGNAYVTGRTRSGNFPIGDPSGTFQSQLAGAQDAFVVKLNAAGNHLLYSSYLGGGGSDDGRGISADVFGNVYVTGDTDSSGATPFPTTASAYRTTNAGGTDAFVSKLNPLTTTPSQQLVYATYLGGAGSDLGRALAVDSQGKVYVTGDTASSNFPTVNPYQGTHAGGSDAFVAKLDPGLSGTASLTYGTYLGGSATEEGRGITVDVYQKVYVTGHTQSNNLPNPLGYQTTFGGVADAFVAKLDPALSGINQRLYLTYLGGAVSDSANAIAVDGYGNAYVTGETAGSFPQVGNWQSGYGGGTSDAFVTELRADGTALVYSSYLGGGGRDVGKGIAAGFDGQKTSSGPADPFTAHAFVTGLTESTNFPTRRPFQGTRNGTSDAFVTKVSLAPWAPVLNTMTPDTGVSSSDRVTRLNAGEHVVLSGDAEPGSAVLVSQSGKGVISPYVVVGSDGKWSYDVGNLPEGIHAFTATTTLGTYVSEPSVTFLAAIDNTFTPSAVTLTVPATTYDVTPEVRVTATDLIGLPNGSSDTSYQVRLEVDSVLTNTYAMLQDGYAIFDVQPPLSVASHTLKVHLKDKAGNATVSAAATLNVTSVPEASQWTVTAEFRSYDPRDGDPLLQTGNARIEHLLDLDQSPGAETFGRAALVYNSETVDVRPIVQARVQSASTGTMPDPLPVTLTWNGQVQPTVYPSTAGRLLGEALTVAVQYVPPAPLATGRYPWSLAVTTPLGVRTDSGAAFVINQQDSPYGAGWSFRLTDRLVDITDQGLGLPAGKLRVYGAGGWRFYAWDGAQYVSPPGDPGKLTCAATCSYRAPDGQIWAFNAQGGQTSWTSATGDDTITFAYDATNTRLTTVTMPDNGQSTWAYTGSNLLSTVTAPGLRVYTVTIDTTDSLNTVTQIRNPDSANRNFGYSNPTYRRHLTSATLGTMVHGWAYGSHGRVTNSSAGTGADTTTTTVVPAAVQGLAAPLVVSPPAARTTDGLNHVVRTTLDLRGRLTQRVAGDGGLWQWTRDPLTTWVTEEIDPLNRKTTYQRDTAGYVTLIKFPGDTDLDPIRQVFTYDDGPDPVNNPRHRLLTFQDERHYGTSLQYTYAYYLVAEGDSVGGRHLKSVTNPLSQVTNYAWDWTKKRLQKVTDARGFETVFETDTNRRVEKVREGEKSSDPPAATARRYTTVSFVSSGAGTGEVEARITGQSDITGYAKPAISTYAYDPMNRVTQIVEAALATEQRTTSRSYDVAGQLLTETTGQAATNPHAATDAYTYDTAGRVSLVTEAAGTPFRRFAYATYDAAGNIWIEQDARGRNTLRTYDGANRVLLEAQAWLLPQQRLMVYGYDLAGNRTLTVDSLGRITQSQFDLRNRVERLDEALYEPTVHRWTTFAYDKASNLTGRTRGLADTNPHPISDEWQYDELNRVKKIIEAVGSSVADTTDIVYDVVGNMQSVHEHAPGGPRTDFSYDGLNRRTFAREAANSSNPWEQRDTTATFDAADNLTKQEVLQRDDLSRIYRTDYQYDQLRRATSVVEAPTKPEQRTTTLVHDAADNLLEITEGIATQDEKRLTTRYAYDLHNRRTQGTSAHGTSLARTTWTTHDDVDQVTAVTDPLLHGTRYGHDDLSRPTHTVDALGKLTKLTRDAVGNVVALTDPVGNVSSWVVDALNRVSKDLNPLGVARTYTRDATDNVTRRVDRNNKTIDWTYDERNRGIKEEWGTSTPREKTINFHYNACDCLTGVDFGPPLDTPFSATYDALDRPLTVSLADSGGLMTGAVAFERTSVTGAGQYRADNSLKQQKVVISGATNHTTLNTDDFLGRTTQLRRDDSGGNQLLKVDLKYNSLDQLKEVKRYSGASGSPFSTSDYTYDDAARLGGIDHKLNAVTHAAYGLSYDAADRVTQQVVTYGSATTTNYGYDATDQLTSESVVGGATTAYSYDANGNRTMTGYQTGPANRLTEANGYTYTYDGEGNVDIQQKTGEYIDYDWDYHNLLTRVRIYDAPPGQGGVLQKEETYRYDVFDRRVGQTSTVGGVTTVRQFVWDGDHVLFMWTKVGAAAEQLTNRYLHGPAIDQVFADEQLTGGAGTLWALTDHLGSVRDVIDTSANVKHRVYDGFGKRTSETGAASFMFGFAGREFDEVTGLQYNRARYYSSSVGRWLNEDPIGFQAGDPSLYRYVFNRPINATDPSGLIGPVIDDPYLPGSFSLPHEVWPKEFAGPPTREEVLIQIYRNYAGEMDSVCDFVEGRIIENLATIEEGRKLPPYTLDGVPYLREVRQGSRIFSVGVGIYGGLRGFTGRGSVPSRTLPANSLTAQEVAEVQAIADRYNTRIDVVGSRAAGQGRNIETTLPVGSDLPGARGTTRSDIDFRVDHTHPRVNELIADLQQVGSGAGRAGVQWSTNPAGGVGRETHTPFIRFSPSSQPGER